MQENFLKWCIPPGKWHICRIIEKTFLSTPEQIGIFTTLAKTEVTNKVVVGSGRITHCVQIRIEKIGQHATENGNNRLFKNSCY